MSMNNNPDLEAFFAQINTFVVATVQTHMGAWGEPRDEYLQAVRIFARHSMGMCLGLGPIVKPGLSTDAIYIAVRTATMRELVRLTGEAKLDDYSAEAYVGAAQLGFVEAMCTHLGVDNLPDGPPLTTP